MKNMSTIFKKEFRYNVLLIILFLTSCKREINYKYKSKISSAVLEKIDREEEISDDEFLQNLNEQDDYGKSLLILAVEREDEKLVARLIDLGIDTTIKDRDGNTALMIAERERNEAIISLLDSASALSLIGRAHVVGFDIPLPLPILFTPLIDAINSYNSKTKLDTIEKILRSSDSLKEIDSDGNTPLMIASQNGHHEVVNTLLTYNANIESSINGYTSLMIAAQNGHNYVVTTLYSL